MRGFDVVGFNANRHTLIVIDVRRRGASQLAPSDGDIAYRHGGVIFAVKSNCVVRPKKAPAWAGARGHDNNELPTRERGCFVPLRPLKMETF